MEILIGIVIALVMFGGLGLYIARIYNQLVELENEYENAFAQIEVQLKRRHDLIPNLIDTAKGYMEHEQETLQQVTEARQKAESGLQEAAKNLGDPNAMENLAGAEGMLSGALGGFMATVEDYPDLKANENMMELQDELTTTENKISSARQVFNDAIREYNTYRESFPQVIFAPMFGHPQSAEFLEFEDSEQLREAPDVSF